MDVVSTAFSIVQKAMEAFAWAQANGFLGGSTGWKTYADDFAAIAQNFAGFVTTAISNPGVYDHLDEAGIRAKLTPEGWAAKEARIRQEMGL